jgi:hypothetical protein
MRMTAALLKERDPIAVAARSLLLLAAGRTNVVAVGPEPRHLRKARRDAPVCARLATPQ